MPKFKIELLPIEIVARNKADAIRKFIVRHYGGDGFVVPEQSIVNLVHPDGHKEAIDILDRLNR